MAFASVQDTNVIPNLAAALSDENEKVRIAAAYSLGQTKHLVSSTY